MKPDEGLQLSYKNSVVRVLLKDFRKYAVEYFKKHKEGICAYIPVAGCFKRFYRVIKKNLITWLHDIL